MVAHVSLHSPCRACRVDMGPGMQGGHGAGHAGWTWGMQGGHGACRVDLGHAGWTWGMQGGHGACRVDLELTRMSGPGSTGRQHSNARTGGARAEPQDNAYHTHAPLATGQMCPPHPHTTC